MALAACSKPEPASIIVNGNGPPEGTVIQFDPPKTPEDQRAQNEENCTDIMNSFRHGETHTSGPFRIHAPDCDYIVYEEDGHIAFREPTESEKAIYALAEAVHQ